MHNVNISYRANEFDPYRRGFYGVTLHYRIVLAADVDTQTIQM